MLSWEEERRKIWGLLIELKKKIKKLESVKQISNAEQPAKQAEA